MRQFRVVLPVMLMIFTVSPCLAQMPPMGAPPALTDIKNFDIGAPAEPLTQPLPESAISPEKRALLLEYLRLTRRTSKPESPDIRKMMGLIRPQMPSLMTQITPPGVSMTSMQKKAILEDVNNDANRMAVRTTELLGQNVDLDKITEEVSLKVYDKYFTEQDLREMIAFYHTPVGEKICKQQPAIDKEIANAMMMTSVSPMMQIIRQVIGEEQLFAPSKPTPAK